jgi:hypothetical protein
MHLQHYLIWGKIKQEALSATKVAKQTPVVAKTLITHTVYTHSPLFTRLN